MGTVVSTNPYYGEAKEAIALTSAKDIPYTDNLRKPTTVSQHHINMARISDSKVEVWITKERKATWKQTAKDEGQSLSTIIKIAMADYLQRLKAQTKEA